MKRMMIAGFSCFLIQMNVWAQTTAKYSLQQCIDTALANNIQVKQSGLLTDEAKVNLKQAKANMLPDLNANFDHGINQGRSVDITSNSYVNQSVTYGTYGASTGVMLFNGMNLQNNVKQNKFAFNASKMEFQQAKDNLTLNVILAYLQVLNNEDLLTSAEKQKELSGKQLERLQVLDSVGAVSPSLVSDLKGQTMSDELNILNAKNQLESSKLSLSQLMNVPYSKDMSLERINAEDFLTAYTQTPDDIYGNALKQFSLIKAVEYRTKSSQFAFKSVKGTLFPVLYLSGSAQTNYSSAATNSNGKIGYGEQVKNNIFSGLNVGLQIPIFNRFRVRNNIKLAGIAVKNSELVEERTKVELHQQIEQAHLNMTNAYETYNTLLQQVEAYASSFKAAEIRFASGVGTSIDYLTAKNNLDRASINLISSKYDFVLRKKVLDYYQNVITK
ncbi:MAG: TolC family protein [Ferruginibacter sp.]